jgi:hypothetical protein
MYYSDMAKPSSDVTQKSRGRPSEGQGSIVNVRLAPDLRARVDTWAAENDPPITRSEAIRRLVEKGLVEG